MADKPISNLAVLTFEGQATAEALYEQIQQMEKNKLVVLDDAIILEREPASEHLHTLPGDARTEEMVAPSGSASVEHQVRVKQTRSKKGKYAAIGGGIGLLAGALLGGPIGLLAFGTAGLGAIMAALKDFGIDDASVGAIKQRMKPNSSALLLLGHATDRDAFLAKLREYDAQVVMTSLDPDVERKLVTKLESKS
ncbi:MAG: DUF1269 domain-containing protein [Caldilinea sp.]